MREFSKDLLQRRKYFFEYLRAQAILLTLPTFFIFFSRLCLAKVYIVEWINEEDKVCWIFEIFFFFHPSLTVWIYEDNSFVAGWNSLQFGITNVRWEIKRWNIYTIILMRDVQNFLSCQLIRELYNNSGETRWKALRIQNFCSVTN